MENTMSAMSVLRFLTANIVDAPTKEYLRKPLANSLESTGDYDEATVLRALDRFFGTGLRAVK